MTTKELRRAEIERLIRMNQTKRGFPAGTACAIRIEAYKRLLDFLDTLTDEPVTDCHDLEEAAEEYRQGEVDSGCDYIDDSDGDSLYHSACLTDAFIAGAEWMKAKMLEEAVEGTVFMSFAPGHNQMVMADVDLPTNTKVKIIIVKEGEQ